MNNNIRLTVVLCLTFALDLLLGFMHRLSKPRILSDNEMRGYGAMMLETPRQFSDFALIDQLEQPFTKANLTGKWTLIFFGFTHCPDICPTTLSLLNKVVTPLSDEEKAQVQVVLLSVDPERDTAAKLAEYVPYFNRDFIGVTGNPFQILSLTTQLNAVYTKVALEGDDYTVDHSGNIVVINPKGDYHGFFRPPFEEGSVRVALRSMMYRFEH
jgi:protein SCO1/2